MKTLSVVTWKWTPRPGYRSTYGPETVNVLRRMVARNYPRPHRFICVTDDSTGIDDEVEIVEDRKDFADLPSPHGGANPSCYRRLRMFSQEARELFGPRFVSLDLDCVIVRDMTDVWDRTEDFVIWGDTNPSTLYNGSMVMMTAGARAEVWNDFDPKRSPEIARRAGMFGSDQAWISYRLGPGQPKWTRRDGVYSFRNEIQRMGMRLPENARIVMFHGAHDPWSPFALKLPWVSRNWC